MSTQQVLDSTKAYQLVCGKCTRAVFVVIVERTGVIAVCQGCFTRYKLESIGGVKIVDA